MKSYNDVNTFGDLINYLSTKYSSHHALQIKSNTEITSISYLKLNTDICKATEYFVTNKITNKNIAMIGELSYTWILTFFAIICSGNRVVPLELFQHKDDISNCLKDADIDLIICCNSVLTKLEIEITHLSFSIINNYVNSKLDFNRKIIKDYVKPDDIAILIFTSGTTGVKKIVALSHKNICDNVKCCAEYFYESVKPYENFVPILPLHHMFSITTSILTPLFLGMCLCIGGGIKHINNDLKAFKPSIMIVVPMIVESLYKQIWINARKSKTEHLLKLVIKFSNSFFSNSISMRKVIFHFINSFFGGRLRTIVCGGALLDQNLIDKYSEWGITLLNGYGITECSPVVACNTYKNFRRHSVGKILPEPYCKVSIINNEICVNGSIVTKEYYKSIDETKDSFINGYFKTGDLGYIQDDYLYITGRKKNLITLSDGNNISPEEIEKFLMRSDFIKEAVVYLKKLNGSELLAAIVIPNMDYFTQHELLDISYEINREIYLLNKQLPYYKNIVHIEIEDKAFNRTSLGKIQQRESYHSINELKQ